MNPLIMSGLHDFSGFVDLNDILTKLWAGRVVEGIKIEIEKYGSAKIWTSTIRFENRNGSSIYAKGTGKDALESMQNSLKEANRLY